MKNQNKALWIFPNFLETINELPDKQRADVWRAICEYGLGYEIDIKKFKTSQKMAIKMLIPLLKLRNTGGSVREGEVRNKTGNNQFNKLSDCNNDNVEDNPYPNPEDNSKDNPKDNPEDNSLITRTRTRTGTRTGKGYAFGGEIIKLNERDFNSWRERFNKFDLVAELESLDRWCMKNKPKNWFITVERILDKKNKSLAEQSSYKPFGDWSDF